MLKCRITRPRFRFPLTEEEAVKLLTAAYEAEVEFRHHTTIMDHYTQQNILRVARLLIAPCPKFGLIFCGQCGNGKTTMLYALQSTCNFLSNIDYYREAYPDQKVGLRIVDARELTRCMTRDFHLFYNYSSHFMLGIEDIGREPTEVLDYGNLLNPVIELLEYRYNNQLFTAITTNLTPKQLSEKYGTRIADRFREMLDIVVFENPSYRNL